MNLRIKIGGWILAAGIVLLLVWKIIEWVVAALQL